MAQDGNVGGSQFRIGRILGESFTLLLRNFVPFMIISLVIAIPSFVIQYWQMEAMREAIATGVMPSTGMQSVIGGLVGLLTWALTQSALTYGTLQDLRGQRASMGNCIARGLSAAPRVAIAAILWAIMVSIGTVLLVVPGIILAVMFWVYVPAIVVENSGMTECFRRSSALTKGRRWNIFGLFLVIMIVLFIVELLLVFRLRPEDIMAVVTSGWMMWIASAISVIVTAYFAVMTSVGYYYLRAEKEGISVDDIGKVFD